MPSTTEPGTEVPLKACIDNFFADHQLDGLFCQVCNKNSNFTQNKRFKTFPKYLVVVLQRFVLDSWVPKKLEIALTFNQDEEFNFDTLMGKGLQAHEKAMPEQSDSEPDMVPPELNRDLLNILLQNGVPEVQAEHALFNTGN